jgi:hypothetical protein
MNKPQQKIHEMAGGDLDVWVDPGGGICMKVRTEFNDPVELGEREALALADLLIKLVEDLRKKT